MTSSPILDSQQSFSVIIRDITTRKKVDDFKNDLLAIIAHELRTPISLMRIIVEGMHVSTIQKNKRVAARVRTMDILDLQGELYRLTTFVENILTISRLRVSKFSLQKKNIELSSLIENIVKKMQLIAGAQKRILFNKTGSIIVPADQAKIEQVLINFLDNAIKFTPDKGKIQITAKIIKKKVVVSIYNETNSEIPDDKNLVIFDKFYQLTDKPIKGLGLGLYIAREIVKTHRGNAWIKVKKGEGNIFNFSLPLK